ncbi:Scm-like protein with four mbt domains [Homalodisca vitripennis]|nr:Scm-like protein with four mbt domains [Homalodisca vitripennis]
MFVRRYVLRTSKSRELPWGSIQSSTKHLFVLSWNTTLPSGHLPKKDSKHNLKEFSIVLDGHHYMNVPIAGYQLQHGLAPLEARRKIHDLIFLHKIIIGSIDCPQLLNKIYFHVPGHTRLRDTFARLYYSTTYQQQSTIPRLLRSGNEMGHLVDFFATSPARFREEIIKLVYGTL